MPQKTIVIVGGGFAGVACGRSLRSRLHPGQARIILFSEENYMVFQPLLAEVAGSSILPEAAATPLRVALPGVECRREKVIDIHLAENRLVYETFEGVKRSLAYDQIVIACGSGVNLTAVPGMADHALPFRTVADAVRLRTQISQQLEQAAVEENPARRRFFLTFAVIGGGFSGVEVAGEINDLLNAAEKWYPTIDPKESRVILIHSRDQLLQEVSPTLREFTHRKMADNGVEIVLEKRVKLVTAEGVTLSDGTHFSAATVVGTTGTAPHPFVERMAAAKEKGRLKTRPDLRLEDFDNAWAIGDCALIVNAYDNQPAQPTGQMAEREGKQCAANIARVLAGEPTRPFYFKPLGVLCAIGGHHAVAEILGFKLSGFFTWWVWRTVYLLKLPSLSRKVKVAMDWTWELLFSRDITSVKVDAANRIHDAYIPAGSFVFQAGDPATDFYVIEKGEVEVLRQLDPTREPERLAVFGAGDFFGEMALLEDRLHQASVRARTDVELTVIGKGMFARMSKVLAPLANQLELAIRRRTKIRQKLPQSTAILEQTSMQECLEPLPSAPIAQSTPVAEALTHFAQEKTDFFCVVDADGQLSGVLTRTDLLSAIERMAMLEGAERSRLAVADIMTPNPLYATATDSALIVAEMMRERSLKRLPVVAAAGELKPIGYVRLEVLMSLVLRRLGQL
jgi:NADH dehydrogenase